MKIFSIIFGLLFLISLAQAQDIVGKTLNFNNAVYSGRISNRLDDYKEYILQSTNHDKIAVLRCINRMASFTTNYAEIEITNRTWSINPVLVMQEMTPEDCKKMAVSILIDKTPIDIIIGSEQKFSGRKNKAFYDMEMIFTPKK